MAGGEFLISPTVSKSRARHCLINDREGALCVIVYVTRHPGDLCQECLSVSAFGHK